MLEGFSQGTWTVVVEYLEYGMLRDMIESGDFSSIEGKYSALIGYPDKSIDYL